jgi:hypothetical protein
MLLRNSECRVLQTVELPAGLLPDLNEVRAVSSGESFGVACRLPVFVAANAEQVNRKPST